MKLSSKISMSMGMLTVLMAGLTVYFIFQLAVLNEASREISGRQVALMKLAGEINNAASEYRLREVLHIYTTDAEKMREYEKVGQGLAERVAKDIKELEGLLVTPGARRLFRRTWPYGKNIAQPPGRPLRCPGKTRRSGPLSC